MAVLGVMLGYRLRPGLGQFWAEFGFNWFAARDDLHPKNLDQMTLTIKSATCRPNVLDCKPVASNNFCTKRLAGQEAFTPNRFYTLHHDNFQTLKSFFITGALCQWRLARFFTKEFYTKDLLHRKLFPPKHVFFTAKNFYTTSAWQLYRITFPDSPLHYKHILVEWLLASVPMKGRVSKSFLQIIYQFITPQPYDHVWRLGINIL